MTALAVILEGRPIGRVERTRTNRLRFAYDEDAARTGRTPLSLSMPTADGSVVGERVERFLAALLPESTAALAAVERRYPAVDRRDPLSLLSAIGRDCPGAVQFCPPDEVDAVVSRTGDLEPQTSSDVEQRLAELRTDEDASWTMPGEHWSLGGTQAKFALRRIDGRWYEAHGAQATSHILKPGIHGMKAQALVEHVTMRAAAICGVDVATTEHVEFGSERAVVITRFDRRDESGGLTRLHQEDLCQSLGVLAKYEEHGGPSAARLVRLLRDASPTAADARRNVERLVDGFAFNTVVAAPDAHARNYAVLLAGDRVSLAPLFDVATGLAYDALAGRRLSMSIGGEFVADRVGREEWTRFADENALDPAVVVERVRQIAETVPDAMRTAVEEIEHDDWDGSVAELRSRLLPALDEHVAQVARTLRAR